MTNASFYITACLAPPTDLSMWLVNNERGKHRSMQKKPNDKDGSEDKMMSSVKLWKKHMLRPILSIQNSIRK